MEGNLSDPARPVHVDERAVDADADEFPVEHAGEGQFARRFPVAGVVENPAALLVGKGSLNGELHFADRAVQLVRGDALTAQSRLNARPRRFHPGLVPLCDTVARDLLKYRVDHSPDVAQRIAHPTETRRILG